MKKVSVIKQSPGGENRAELCWAQLDSPHPLNLTRGVTTTFSTLSLVQFCLDNGVHFALCDKIFLCPTETPSSLPYDYICVSAGNQKAEVEKSEGERF